MERENIRLVSCIRVKRIPLSFFGTFDAVQGGVGIVRVAPDFLLALARVGIHIE